MGSSSAAHNTPQASLTSMERAVLTCLRAAPDGQMARPRIADHVGVARQTAGYALTQLCRRDLVVGLGHGVYQLTATGMTVDMDSYRWSAGDHPDTDPLAPATPIDLGQLTQRGRDVLRGMQALPAGRLTYGQIVAGGFVSSGQLSSYLRMLRCGGFVVQDYGEYLLTDAGRAADLGTVAPATPSEPSQPKPPQHVGHMPPEPPPDTRKVVKRLPSCPRCGGMLGVDLLYDPPEVVCIQCNRTAQALGLPYKVRRRKAVAHGR